jgi:hypothetical protein
MRQATNATSRTARTSLIASTRDRGTRILLRTLVCLPISHSPATFPPSTRPRVYSSIANKLAREAKRENEPEHQDEETMLHNKDATLPARAHGNEPSKGAKIDQELKEEEEEYLMRKGKGDALPGKK